MRPRRLAAVVALSIGATMIASSACSSSIGRERPIWPPNLDDTARGTPSRRPYADFLDAARTDIEEFWLDNYDDLYGPDYLPLAGGVHAASEDRIDDVPTGCDFTGDYGDVEDNAFYCDEGDFIVFDDDLLFPSFVDDFGIASLGVILAHEWGHVVQSPLRNDVLFELDNVTLELQADCFAGAWSADARDTGVGEFALTEEDVTNALLALFLLGDLPGDSASDLAAHGSAFDRISSFQDGYLGGPSTCADYEVSPPTPLQFGFTAEELSRENPSDLPFDQEMFDLMAGDLAIFWNAVIDTRTTEWRSPELFVGDESDLERACAEPDRATIGVVVCADDFAVWMDVAVAEAAYYETPGDFAVAYLLGVGFGDVVQSALDLGLTGQDRHLMNDCLAGMWAGDALPLNLEPVVPSTEDSPRISLSPGDLDEAIRMAMFLGDVTDSDTELAIGWGTPFEKVDAFRQGVLYGADGCFGA